MLKSEVRRINAKLRVFGGMAPVSPLEQRLSMSVPWTSPEHPINPCVTTLNTQNRRQKFSICGFTFVQGAWHSENDETPLNCSAYISIWRYLELCLGRLSPTKSPMATGLSIPPLLPGSYPGNSRPINHVLNAINNTLDMISQHREYITT